jgi:hypothetical protein
MAERFQGAEGMLVKCRFRKPRLLGDGISIRPADCDQAGIGTQGGWRR